MSNLINLMYRKRVFLLLVFANLFLQLSISYYVMVHTNKTSISHWYLFGIQMLIIFLIGMFPMPAFMKFILFTIFSYTFGLSLTRYKEIIDERVIEIAIKGTLSLFALMMGSGIALMIGGINLGPRFGAFLFWSLLLLIVLRIIFIFGNALSMTQKGLSGAAIILFSMFIVYDTQQILSRNYAGDFISASMDYYLDIINLFINLLGYGHDN